MQDFSKLWTSEARFLGALFREGSHEIRIVGGAVRDFLHGQEPKDIDLTTDATPEEMLAMARTKNLRIVESGLKHGTVSFIVNHQMLEVTTLRQDVETDGRHATVKFIRDFSLDAARRDFTINAMSVDIDGGLHDYFGGTADLAGGVVKFVGDPGERIREDYLRILRYFRFRGRFVVAGPGDARISGADAAALEAVRENRAGLQQISGERIWQEMGRVITDPGGFAELAVMEDTGTHEAIGLPRNLDLRLAKTAMRSHAPAAVVLGFMLAADGSITPDTLRDRWKFGTEELLLARAAWDLAPLSAARFREFLDLAMLPNARRDRIASVLVGFGRHDEANLINGRLAEFPVHGRDLIAAGMDPGPAIGRALSDMRTAWKASNYEATLEDLLATLPPVEPSRGP